ncbi:unnamed protein product [Adineta steineri]|uniref:Uncharacterized protein n=1 Tax=Adineta steineri TaxID=433720 RepID=A0A814PRS6_9BILA|nr:unnamed protein product [Adineta steineri]
MNSYSKRGACPELYRGLKWSGFEYMYESYARMKHANSGYVYAFQSTDSSCIIFSSSHASISVDPPNEAFSVLALTACAAWIDNLQLTITGHRNSIKIKNHVSALRFGINRDDHSQHIEQFNNDFYNAIQQQIDQCVQSRIIPISDPLHHEILEHAIECKTYVAKFHGRTDILNSVS